LTLTDIRLGDFFGQFLYKLTWSPWLLQPTYIHRWFNYTNLTSRRRSLHPHTKRKIVGSNPARAQLETLKPWNFIWRQDFVWVDLMKWH
jgi:hypothetical protein